MKKVQILSFLSAIALMSFTTKHENCAKNPPITIADSQTINPYVGTWEYQKGNEYFVVSIWQEEAYLFGNYRKVIMNNGIITSTIYNSGKDFGNGLILPKSVIVGSSDLENFTEIIHDTLIPNSDTYQDGKLTMKVLPGCSGCPITASWKVVPHGDMIVGSRLPFSLPTDIILTKVQGSYIED